MEAELAALAASGATTLVGLMVSETWTQARDRLARFFARGGDESAAEEELRVSRGELVAAREAGDEDAAADIEAAWRTRLRRALQADPTAVAELRSLLAEFEPDGGGAPAGTVRNSISGGTQYGPVLQGQQFSGLTFHSSAPEPEKGTTERE
ncbi:hypothetical protein AB0M97_28990 [Streptomyces sp. NPDC051207]|uniref:hypothetical protein n=1 Tax=Streptomyces sp. NPDC051207 TaxID=3154641 RepID=UPI0034148620